MFHQSHVVAVVVIAVVVVVEAYSPVTGNHARQLCGSTLPDDVRPMKLRMAPPLLAVVGTGAGKSPAVSGDALPPLGGDATPDKGSAGDAAPGEGAAGVRKSFLVRSWIWSTNSWTCGWTNTPLAFSRLVEMLAVKSRTPV